MHPHPLVRKKTEQKSFVASFVLFSSQSDGFVLEGARESMFDRNYLQLFDNNKADRNELN